MIAILLHAPAADKRAERPVLKGVVDGIGAGKVTFVPLIEELLPTTGTEMLYCEQTPSKSVVKATLIVQYTHPMGTLRSLLTYYTCSCSGSRIVRPRIG